MYCWRPFLTAWHIVVSMTSSLFDPVVSRVLAALHSEADIVDPPLLAKIGDNRDDEMAHLLDQAFIPVSPDAGRFLYSLVRATNTGTVIEFGTSLASRRYTWPRRFGIAGREP